MSKPTRDELLNTIAMLNLALNGISIELTQGYNTMPRRRSLREAVENSMDWSFCARKVLERAQYKAEGQLCEVKSMTDLYDLLDAENDATKAEGNA